MLPIGSIVYLKEGTSKVMILNRGPVVEQDGEELMYDYSACLYPQGLSPERVFYFNQENVDEVVFKGFADGDEERFQKLFKEWKEENTGQIKQGKVDKPLSKEKSSI